jgi:hypothetical protein
MAGDPSRAEQFVKEWFPFIAPLCALLGITYYYSLTARKHKGKKLIREEVEVEVVVEQLRKRCVRQSRQLVPVAPGVCHV